METLRMGRHYLAPSPGVKFSQKQKLLVQVIINNTMYATMVRDQPECQLWQQQPDNYYYGLLLYQECFF